MFKPIPSWVLMICLSAFLPSARADAPKAPVHVGLLTQVSGEVTYRSALTGNQGEAAQAFMKVRLKDRFQLKKDAELRLLFYSNGRQESWKGPAGFEVQEGKTRKLSGAKPQVASLPTRATRDVRRVPALLRRAGGRVGGTLLRGKEAGDTEAVPLSAEEQAELKAARQVYQQMRSLAPKDDITPELYLLSILDDYELNAEMMVIVKKARAIQPKSKPLSELEDWLRKQTVQKKRD